MSNQIGDQKSGFEALMSEMLGVYWDTHISDVYKDAIANVAEGGYYHALRFLVFTRSGDYIRLPPVLKVATLQALAHFRTVGIEAVNSQNIYWSDTFAHGLNSGQELQGFMFDEQANAVRPDQRRLSTTMKLENKSTFTTQWAENGVPKSVSVGSSASITPEWLWWMIEGQPGIFKLAFTASGSENISFQTFGELKLILGSRNWDSKNYVVQQLVGETDVSVNYFADEEGVHFLFSTCQEVDGYCHKGNLRDDSIDEICRSVTDKKAVWAWQNGYRGFFGFDLRMDVEKKQVWVIECNARVTAPLYGWLLSMRLEVPWFAVKNMEGLTAESIEELVPKHLWYSPEKGEGVIVHNAGLLLVGECSITVLAKNKKRGAWLIEEMERGVSQRLVA